MTLLQESSNRGAIASDRLGAGHRPLTYYYNGNILTMNQNAPVAPHMLVMRDRVWHAESGAAPLGLDFRDSAFGTTRKQLANEVKFVDLRGRTVIPGLVDSHVHFVWWADYLTLADLNPATSEGDAVGIVQRHCSGARPKEWLVGFGWSHNLWGGGGKLPSRASLDAVFPDNPVFLSSKCGHLAWVNSAALAAAGIDATTADPAGGEIERMTENGVRRLTGVLKENAISLVREHIGGPTDERRYQALKRGQQLAHSLGLTGMQTPEDLDTWGFLQRAHERNALRTRINFWIPVDALDHLEALQIRHGLGDEWLRISAVKLFTDGSLGGRTALMYDPYENEPDNRGICVTERDDLIQATLKANRAGLAMAVHAIGDRAVDYVLSAYEASMEELGEASTTNSAPPVRNRIEHLQVFSERDLSRLRRVKPIASMQPVHLCADMGPADKFWGKRSRFAYACRTLTEAGCLLAFGSDAPVEPINPFYGLYAATTRSNLEGNPKEGWYPEEKLSVEEALAAYTTNPAIASGQSGLVGDLSSGKLADFLVLPENPITATPEGLRDMKPVATYIAGELVHNTGDWSAHD